MSFPKYEAYKDSGVEWLGEVPEHWKLMRLRHLILDGAEGIRIGPFGSQLSSEILVEFGYKVYGQENIISQDFSRGHRFITTEKFKELAVYTISPGDLLITMMGTAGRCKTVPENISQGIMDSHLLRMRFQKLVLSKFIETLIDSSVYIEHQIKLNGKGSIMHGLNSSIVKELIMLIPAIEEQSSILKFINHETAQIDALITEQQRLIELLKEKRQAVISHAVTKGLDPTAPMKDSGVEWLGEVPAHWKVGSLGYYSKIDTGATPDRSKPEYWNGNVPWVKTGEVKYEPIFQTEEYVSIEGVNNSATHIAPKGTLLMAMYGQGVTRGRVAVLGINAAYNQACAGISVGPKLKVSFLHDYLMAAYSYIRDDGNETSQMNLSSGYVAKIKVTVPPVEEQVAISNFVGRERDRFDSLISEVTSLAQFLQERRSALISAAVTGKIDVRGWQAPVSPVPTLEAAYG